MTTMKKRIKYLSAARNLAVSQGKFTRTELAREMGVDNVDLVRVTIYNDNWLRRHLEEMGLTMCECNANRDVSRATHGRYIAVAKSFNGNFLLSELSRRLGTDVSSVRKVIEHNPDLKAELVRLGYKTATQSRIQEYISAAEFLSRGGRTFTVNNLADQLGVDRSSVNRMMRKYPHLRAELVKLGLVRAKWGTSGNEPAE